MGNELINIDILQIIARMHFSLCVILANMATTESLKIM